MKQKEKSVVSYKKFSRVTRNKPVELCFIHFNKNATIDETLYELKAGVPSDGWLYVFDVDKHGNEIFTRRKIHGLIGGNLGE